MSNLKCKLRTKIEKKLIKSMKYYGIPSVPQWIYEVAPPKDLPEMLQKVKKEMEEDEKNH